MSTTQWQILYDLNQLKYHRITKVPAADANTSRFQLGSTISSGNSSGTWLGLNAASGYTGDLCRFQINNQNVFQVGPATVTTGSSTASGGLSVWGVGGEPVGLLNTATKYGVYINNIKSLGAKDLALTYGGLADNGANTGCNLWGTSTLGLGTGSSSSQTVTAVVSSTGFRAQGVGSASNNSTQDALRIQPSGTLNTYYRPFTYYAASGDASPTSQILTDGSYQTYGGLALLSPGRISCHAGTAASPVIYKTGGTEGFAFATAKIGACYNSSCFAAFDSNIGVSVRPGWWIGWTTGDPLSTGLDTSCYFERYAAATIRTPGKFLATTGLGVGNSAAATTPGSVVKKVQLFSETGTSLGYLAVYDAIT